MLQSDNSDFILAMNKEVETHEARIHWALMKKVKLKISKKVNMGSSGLFYSFVLSGAIDSQMYN